MSRRSSGVDWSDKKKEAALHPAPVDTPIMHVRALCKAEQHLLAAENTARLANEREKRGGSVEPMVLGVRLQLDMANAWSVLAAACRPS